MPSPPPVLAAAAAGKLARRHPGVVIGALDGAGPPVVRVAGQVRRPDGAPPTAATVFEIGSITKVFTALALADAVLRGETTLAAPVRELLPAGSNVPTRRGVEMTLEHLATHTSGLPRSPLGSVELRRTNPYDDVSADDLLAALGRTRLRRKPGTGHPSYSNFGFALLGVALTALTGAGDYEELILERVCRPLGLTDTVVSRTPEQRQRSASGHRWRGRPAQDWHLTGLAGAGALRSTAVDMLRFARAQLHPESTPLGPAITLTQRSRRAGRRPDAALGWSRTTVAGEPTLWHNGGTGGFRSFLGVAPGHDRAVVALTNSFNLRGPDLVALRLLRQLRQR